MEKNMRTGDGMKSKTLMRPAIGGCLAALMVSCATPALWDATDPDQWVKADNTAVGTNDLAARGVEYRYHEATGDIYIPKSQLHKLGDYTLRALATPITVTLDAVGMTTIVCGAVLAGAALDSATSSPTDPWGRPIDEATGSPVPGQRPIRGNRPWYNDEDY